jgi:hypothetical protein
VQHIGQRQGRRVRIQRVLHRQIAVIQDLEIAMPPAINTIELGRKIGLAEQLLAVVSYRMGGWALGGGCVQFGCSCRA